MANRNLMKLNGTAKLKSQHHFRGRSQITLCVFHVFLTTYTGRKYGKSLYSTLLQKSYVDHLSWIVKKSIKTYALHLMINPTHKQRLEVSKKVPYITLGHEAAKLEAVKL